MNPSPLCLSRSGAGGVQIDRSTTVSSGQRCEDAWLLLDGYRVHGAGAGFVGRDAGCSVPSAGANQVCALQVHNNPAREGEVGLPFDTAFGLSNKPCSIMTVVRSGVRALFENQRDEVMRPLSILQPIRRWPLVTILHTI